MNFVELDWTNWITKPSLYIFPGKPVSYRDDEDDVEQPPRASDESSESRPSGNLESGDLQENNAEPAEPDLTSADVVLDEEQNDRSENGEDMSATASGDSVQDITPIINLISDDEDDDEDEEEESDQDVELAAETSIFSNVSLKLVYDVQYRAPEWAALDRQSFSRIDCETENQMKAYKDIVKGGYKLTSFIFEDLLWDHSDRRVEKINKMRILFTMRNSKFTERIQ